MYIYLPIEKRIRRRVNTDTLEMEYLILRSGHRDQITEEEWQISRTQHSRKLIIETIKDLLRFRKCSD